MSVRFVKKGGDLVEKVEEDSESQPAQEVSLPPKSSSKKGRNSKRTSAQKNRKSKTKKHKKTQQFEDQHSETDGN